MNNTETNAAVTASEKPEALYAIIEAGGQQVKVSQGDRISLNSLQAEVGSEIVIDKVLFVRSPEAEGVCKFGAPYVDGVTVVAKVLEHTRGPKVVAFKKRRRQRYKRKVGHRQDLTMLLIKNIAGI